MDDTRDVDLIHRTNAAALVGRDRELAMLRQAFARTLAGDGLLAVISGEAGIGKTALVDAFGAEAKQAGTLVLRGHCYDLSTTPPYGPWLEIADRSRGGNDLPELSHVLRRGTDVGNITNQTALFDVVRDYLTSVAETHPLVLVLEDLHWSDLASLDLLRFLSRQLNDCRLLILATYRDEEVTREHDLFQVLPALIRESDPVRIDLHPLNEADVSDLLARRYELQSGDAHRLGQYLRRQGEGNPLFIRELLRTLEDERVLHPDGDRWKLDDLQLAPIPTLLRQVIERRLGRLDNDHRAILDVAAVIGHEVHLDLWQDVSETTDEELGECLRIAIDAHILSEWSTGRSVRFTHALIRKAVYSGIVITRRRNLHQRIADALISTSDPDPDKVAYHLQQAGDERAVDWLVQAGERAIRAYAWLTASERFDHASILLDGKDLRRRERGWLLYRSGRLIRFADLPRSIALLEKAELIGNDVGDRVLSAYALADRGIVHAFSGDMEQCLTTLTSGVAAIDAIPDDYAVTDEPIEEWLADIVMNSSDRRRQDDALVEFPRINIRRGVLLDALSQAGHFREVISSGEPYFQKLVAIADPDQNLLSSLADVASALSLACASLGKPDSAHHLSTLASDTASKLGHYLFVTNSAVTCLDQIYLPYWTDRLNERQRLVEEMRAHERLFWGKTAPDDFGVAVCFSQLFVEGNWREIRSQGPSALASIAEIQRRRAAIALARVARETGKPDDAWQQLKRLLPHGIATEPGMIWFVFCLDAQQVAADLALDSSDLERAWSWIEAHDRWLEWSGAVRGRAEGQLRKARYQRMTGDIDAALRHGERALNHAENPTQPLALIAARRFLGELDTQQRRFAEADEHLKQTLALAEACTAPFERALTLLALAELHAATGEPAESRKLLIEVVSICEPLEAKPTLERAESLSARLDRRPRERHPAGLTRREIEVLRLIAQGMPDREIADKLFISHHTVMRHVSHILAKLEVESRTAAAAQAVRLGLV